MKNFINPFENHFDIYIDFDGSSLINYKSELERLVDEEVENLLKEGIILETGDLIFIYKNKIDACLEVTDVHQALETDEKSGKKIVSHNFDLKLEK